MCGICGVYNYRNREDVSSHILSQMADSIAHRGPDDEGYYTSPKGYGAGFRRLSIIDLAGGHQPMSDDQEQIWVTFNGEIYNFPELRKILEQKGYKFRTNADTEVILHGYKEWGDQVLQHLNGMFGFAIWDNIAERLLLARDRMGIKLVYYHDDGSRLVYGSEIRAVKAGLENSPDISPLSLNLFLRYRYTPSEHTIYKNIKKLAPGTCLVIEKGTATVRTWWDYEPHINYEITENEAIDKLEYLFKASMKRHLLSDVPLGLLLSGGMDSALLLSLMNLYGNNWNTYTVGFGTSFQDDEISDAETSSNILGSNHKTIEINQEDFEYTLPKVIQYLEEPIASASIVPMFYVCQKAAEDVKVALIGQGPDELFGGYTRHIGLRYGSYWRKIPSAIRKPVKRYLKYLPRNAVIKRSLYSLDQKKRMVRYQNVFSLAPAKDIDDLFLEGILPESPGDEILSCWTNSIPKIKHNEELSGFQYLEMRSSLPDELLMYADKLSMAHSLELRVPYLDKEIVEFVETIPDRIKIKWFSRKLLHKRVAKRFLPGTIIKRKKKGFSQNVVDDWFRSSLSGKMQKYFSDTNSKMYNYLNKTKTEKLIKQHQSGRHDHYKLLFSMVVFEEWLRQNEK